MDEAAFRRKNILRKAVFLFDGKAAFLLRKKHYYAYCRRKENVAGMIHCWRCILKSRMLCFFTLASGEHIADVTLSSNDVLHFVQDFPEKSLVYNL